MNIIIIDDDPLVVESLKTIINANGINILAIGYDGLEAVKLYDKYRPDLMLMDIRMEKMNGIEATKEILALCQYLGWDFLKSRSITIFTLIFVL
ncbi:response regulator receiver domain-containing protein [Keratinibaculum paraultunense]|uniref:Response regulator receiver domain-containing protein n=1 Tax=Keratinibaculum paraultunense TaxID=1278232 RepID=A0A4R3KSN2_9FIRM|nr:response regulator transcription factor [Keratinibaculum paraultunense]TCS87439.1 response regulator receiver domain-containing protein [Keratinibaculum paraultunense]